MYGEINYYYLCPYIWAILLNEKQDTFISLSHLALRKTFLIIMLYWFNSTRMMSRLGFGFFQCHGQVVRHCCIHTPKIN